jgi:flagellar assembly protein FliH
LPDAVKIGGNEPEEEPPDLTDGEEDEAADVADDLRRLHERVAELQARVESLEGENARLSKRAADVDRAEAELNSVRSSAARREAEITASLAAETEKARAEGLAKGQAEGEKRGYTAGLEKAKAEVSGQYSAEFDALVKLLEGVSKGLEENFSGLVDLNQPRMLRLWRDMLGRMLRRELTLMPDVVLDVLSDVLSRLSDKNRILIYVSPQDMNMVRDALRGEFQEILRGVKHLELKSDTRVDRGSCIVETDLGVYDARWRTQLEQVDGAVESILQKLGKPIEMQPKQRGRGRETQQVPSASIASPAPSASPEPPAPTTSPAPASASGAADTPGVTNSNA